MHIETLDAYHISAQLLPARPTSRLTLVLRIRDLSGHCLASKEFGVSWLKYQPKP